VHPPRRQQRQQQRLRKACTSGCQHPASAQSGLMASRSCSSSCQGCSAWTAAVAKRSTLPPWSLRLCRPLVAAPAPPTRAKRAAGVSSDDGSDSSGPAPPKQALRFQPLVGAQPVLRRWRWPQRRWRSSSTLPLSLHLCRPLSRHLLRRHMLSVQQGYRLTTAGRGPLRACPSKEALRFPAACWRPSPSRRWHWRRQRTAGGESSRRFRCRRCVFSSPSVAAPARPTRAEACSRGTDP